MSDLPRIVNHHNYHVSSLPNNSTGAPLNPKSLASSDRSIIMGSSPTPHHHHQQARKVQVVYYLSRSGHLEHPHLLEISLPPKVEGLYLRDVKKKLAMIRGKRLPSAFAWSYKRSYKNGYVWQDLCDDDLIYPAHGCEYVLKGSEIIAETAHQNEKCSAAAGDNAVDREEEAVQEQKLRACTVNQDSGAGLQGHLAQPSSKSNTNGNRIINAKVIDARNHAAVINGFQSTETETSDEEVGSHVWKPLPSSNSSSSNSSCNNNNNKELIDGGLTTSTGPPATAAPVYYRHHRVQKTAMILVESGTDAATQTDEEVQDHAAPTTSNSEGSTSSSSTQAGVVDSDHGTKPAPETKSIHPFSGALNSTDAAADVKAAAHHDQAVQERAIGSSSKNAGTITAASPPSPLSSSRSTEATVAAMCSNADASMSPLRKPSCGRLSLYPAASNNYYNNNNTSSESEPSSARPPRSCKALSLLHLVSCGGLDVKEQILPAMSLTYHLKSASSSAPFKPSSSPNPSSSHMPEQQLICTAEALGYGAPQAPKSTSSPWKGAAASANMTTVPKAKTSRTSSHNIESYPEYNSTKAGGISSCVSSPISSFSSGLRSSLFNQSKDHATTCSTPRSLTGSEAAVLPDVISLSRSSISDRSTNVSRELDYQTPRKHDKSGTSPSTLRQHIINGRDQPSEGGSRNIPEYSPRAGNCRRAVSGEIFRGSPLFVPSSSSSSLSSMVAGASTSSLYYSLQNRAASMSFRHPAAGVPAPPPVASERPLIMRADTVQAGNNVSHNHNHPHNIKIHNSNSMPNDSNGPIAVQQLWQDLSASAASAAADGSSPSIIKDSRRPVALEGTWDQQWERTLQNAIDLSLPPMELLVFHECPKCNRKLKPELLKAHTKTCNSSPLYTNNAASNFCINSNMMMMTSKASSPRPQKVVDGSLYHRFLKASPPPKL